MEVCNILLKKSNTCKETYVTLQRKCLFWLKFILFKPYEKENEILQRVYTPILVATSRYSSVGLKSPAGLLNCYLVFQIRRCYTTSTLKNQAFLRMNKRKFNQLFWSLHVNIKLYLSVRTTISRKSNSSHASRRIWLKISKMFLIM